MPTHFEDPRFVRDFSKLSADAQARFRAVVRMLVADLKIGHPRPALRVKRVRSHPGVWEISFGPDDRATFKTGQPRRPGDPHIIWRRVGSHDIFRDP